MTERSMQPWHFALPKAELHLHIEGTLEPELMFELADRNSINLPYASVEKLRAAYDFADLQSFLDLYYAGMNVLRTAEDFRDLANAYFARARAQGVVHGHIFFDPQAHIMRGIPFETVLEGLWDAFSTSLSNHGYSSQLIPSFLRDQSVQSAMETYDLMVPHLDKFVGIGLDSAERGNPPSKFRSVFARAAADGLKRCVHLVEEGPIEYGWEGVSMLFADEQDVPEGLDKDTIFADQGDHCTGVLEDDALVDRMVELQLPITSCPLSNVRLKVVERMEDHPLKRQLERGLLVTVNSDDPAYFGGYVGDNFEAVINALGLSEEEVVTLCANSFTASFLSEAEKQRHIDNLHQTIQELTGRNS